MPLFEYACRTCHAPFEALVQGRKRPSCPSCGSRELERRLSGFAVGSKAATPTRASAPCGSCGSPEGPGSCRS